MCSPSHYCADDWKAYYDKYKGEARSLLLICDGLYEDHLRYPHDESIRERLAYVRGLLRKFLSLSQYIIGNRDTGTC
jgi:hypothetical protein